MNIILNKIANNESIILDKIEISGFSNVLVKLERSFSKEQNQDYYFIKFYEVKKDGQHINMGYMYFYLDLNLRKSTYVGSYVKPDYRSKGLASMLIAYWIQFCFDNNFYDLTTNKTQRKPFLLYILKSFFFEIENPNDYLTSNYNIHICMLPNDKTKYLVFENSKQALTFKEGKIYKNDNYQILDFNTKGIIKLDTVLL